MLKNASWNELGEVLLYGDHIKIALMEASDENTCLTDSKMNFCYYTMETT